MRSLGSVLTTGVVLCVLSSCDGVVATMVVNQMIDLTMYYGQEIAGSFAAKTVEALFDQVFSPQQSTEQKIVLDPNDPEHATATKLVLNREKPPCHVEQDNVRLTWDAQNNKWQANPTFLQRARAACDVVAGL